jgi:hypothetical protein
MGLPSKAGRLREIFLTIVYEHSVSPFEMERLVHCTVESRFRLPVADLAGKKQEIKEIL